MILATVETITITIASVIGICGLMATLFLIIYNHSTNDKKHLKEGQEPILSSSYVEIHKGCLQTMYMMREAIKENEIRSSKAVDDLKADMKTQFEQVLESLRCMETKILNKVNHNG